jgi:stearoyl-CoA desaturase (delta-9 desaturase)
MLGRLLVALAVAAVVDQMALLATTVYLHRGLAHRSLTMAPALALVPRVVIWTTTGMKPREWIAVHRRHHASTDTVDDPHSPAVLGFWRVQLTNAALYRRVARDGTTVDRYARDVPPDRLDRLLFDHAALGLGLGVTALCLAFGWQLGLLVAVVHGVLYLGASGAINALGHTVGRRPHANSGTNGRLLALVTAGEALHNNHHAAPTAARFSRGRGELDPAWWLIRALATARMVRLRPSTRPAASSVAT